jgi:hypothetical protein
LTRIARTSSVIHDCGCVTRASAECLNASSTQE